ncbi:MAG: ribonuclease P protein component, partial [Ruthenibacterium sp.]
NAVTRNRARRVIRAALFAVLPQNIGGFDLVFVARVRTAKCKSTQLAVYLAKLLQNAGLLK